MATAKKTKVVYLAYTYLPISREKVLLKIYSKSSYQTAYNWLANIADAHGVRVLPCLASDTRAAQVGHPTNGQYWYLERHEVA